MAHKQPQSCIDECEHWSSCEQTPPYCIMHSIEHSRILEAALRGCADMLRESARMMRLKGSTGHASMSELHEKQAREALAAADRKQA